MVWEDLDAVLPGTGPEPMRCHRDGAGLEADAAIEPADGRRAAIEIKTSDKKVPGAVASLGRLRRKPSGDERPSPRSLSDRQVSGK